MSSFIPRPAYLDWLKAWQGHDLVKVITGVRRCGKSTILELFRRELANQGVDKEHLLTINLEEPEAERDLAAGLALYDHIKAELPGNDTMTYVFIDEAQHLQELERTVAGLSLLPNVDLYLTGSNSDFLSRDLATRLTGRYVELHVFPLSYAEFVRGFDPPAPAPGQAPVDPWQIYLRDGGFPYTLRLGADPAMVRQYLSDILSTVVLRDIAPRQESFNPTLFHNILEFMVDNIGNLTSVSRVSNTLTSLGRKTGRTAVESYLDGLMAAYLLYPARRYDVKGKSYLENSAKYYLVDLGMRRALLGASRSDSGHRLENIVFLELLRRHEKVSVGKVGPAEIDFLSENGEDLTYIQVCQSVADPAVLDRELAPLRAISDNHPRLLLVGEDRPPENHQGIRQLSVRDWLLAG